MTGSTANGLTTIAYGAWPWPVFSIHAVAVVAPAGPPAPPPKAYTVADQGAQHRREIADDLQLQMQQGLSRPRSRPEWVWIVGPGMFGTIIVVSDDVDPRGISRLSTRTNAWRRCLTPHREKGNPEDVPEENHHNDDIPVFDKPVSRIGLPSVRTKSVTSFTTLFPMARRYHCASAL